MLINGKRFDGSTALVDTNRRLRALVGPATNHYTEFQPISYRGREVMEQVLMFLFRHDFCCFVSGTFSTFLAAVFSSYRAITLFIALDYDSPLQTIPFQRGDFIIHSIDLGSVCQLQLTEALHNIDAMAYRIYADDYSATLILFGVDTTRQCGPSSNVDLAHFIWTNFEHFAFKKYSMTVVPSHTDPTRPTLLYLQHH
jgi:hypothetical protein